MNKISIVVALVAILALSACGLTKKDVGLEKRSPDASQASLKAPLTLPPNYNLRPVVPMEKTEDSK